MPGSASLRLLPFLLSASESIRSSSGPNNFAIVSCSATQIKANVKATSLSQIAYGSVLLYATDYIWSSENYFCWPKRAAVLPL